MDPTLRFLIVCVIAVGVALFGHDILISMFG